MIEDISQLAHDLKGCIRRQKLIFECVYKGAKNQEKIPKKVIDDMSDAIMEAKKNWDLFQNKVGNNLDE